VNVDVVGDLFVATLLIIVLLIAMWIRHSSVIASVVMFTLGVAMFVGSGIDSAIKLFSPEWAFGERLYHFAWVWVGIFFGWVFIRAWRSAWRSVVKDRE
jgi:hypothetical protein